MWNSKRNCFIILLAHPTHTDLRKNINNDIVDIFIKTCNPMRKILLGANKPMQGPTDLLWIDPEDQFKDIAQFTRPIDITCISSFWLTKTF